MSPTTQAPIAEQGLLQAICTNPLDNTLRLVYSDWLEEHGGSERAEFIRLQLELADQRAGKFPASAANDCRQDVLEQRCDYLLGKYGVAWIKEALGGPETIISFYGVKTLYSSFRRGFIEHIECRLEDWCGTTRAPLPELRLTEVRQLSAGDRPWDKDFVNRSEETWEGWCAWEDYHPPCLARTVAGQLISGAVRILATTVGGKPALFPRTRLIDVEAYPSTSSNPGRVRLVFRPLPDPGDQCPQCSGYGKVTRQQSGQEGKTTTVDCYRCRGSGTLVGKGPELVLAAPLLEVRLTDRAPYNSYSPNQRLPAAAEVIPTWTWGTYQVPGHPEDCSSLPKDVFELLPCPTNDDGMADREDHITRVSATENWIGYCSEREAWAACAFALVQWARIRAELPLLEWNYHA